MQNFQIAFIGAGNMASCLIGGLISRGLPTDLISASDPFPEALARLNAQFPGVRTDTDNHGICRGADIIIIATKPQVLKKVALELAPTLSGQQPLIISIAAGINITSLEQWLGPQLPIVRCMPNTPALMQLGASGLFANNQVNDSQKQLSLDIMSAVGIAIWVDSEKDIDAVTALSGSGPAYYFLLMEAMIEAGIQQGLKPDIARQLTLQTALGAATMAAQSEEPPTELRRRVTSPGGTTEQAINQFLELGFPDIVKQAIDAAAKRSKTLSDELGD